MWIAIFAGFYCARSQELMQCILKMQIKGRPTDFTRDDRLCKVFWENNPDVIMSYIIGNVGYSDFCNPYMPLQLWLHVF